MIRKKLSLPFPLPPPGTVVRMARTGRAGILVSWAPSERPGGDPWASVMVTRAGEDRGYLIQVPGTLVQVRA